MKQNRLFPFVCVLDFEATCEDVKGFDHEIIEFPSVLLKWNAEKQNYEKVSQFQMYCRPLDNATVTKFCTDLTGITQEMVDKGENFPKVLTEHSSWLQRECQLANENSPLEDRVIIVTCGAWDLKTVFPKETRRWNIPNPEKVYRRYINLKAEFARIHKLKKQKGMAEMLQELHLTLDGRHHSGIDDCHNIAKILMTLVGNRFDIRDSTIVTTPDRDYRIRANKKKYKRYRDLINQRYQQQENE